VPLWLQYPGSGTASFECQDNVYQSLHSVVDWCCLLLPALDTNPDGEGIIVVDGAYLLAFFCCWQRDSIYPTYCAGYVILVVMSKDAYII
jgi:hypothetical protein